MDKFVILGAAGNTGRELLRQFYDYNKLNRKYNLTAAIHSKNKLPIVDSYSDNSIITDYSNIEDLYKLLYDAKYCYIVLSRNDNEKTHGENIIKAIEKSPQIQHIFYLSAINSGSRDMVSDSKSHIESLIMKSGISHTIICPTFFMNRFLYLPYKKLNKSIEIYAPVANGKVSFIDTYDIVRLVIKTFKNNDFRNKTVTLTGSKALTLGEICKCLSLQTNFSFYHINQDPHDCIEHLRKKGYSDLQVKMQMQTFKLWREGMCETIYNDFYNFTNLHTRGIEGFIESNLSTIKDKYEI